MDFPYPAISLDGKYTWKFYRVLGRMFTYKTAEGQSQKRQEFLKEISSYDTICLWQC